MNLRLTTAIAGLAAMTVWAPALADSVRGGASAGAHVGLGGQGLSADADVGPISVSANRAPKRMPTSALIWAPAEKD